MLTQLTRDDVLTHVLKFKYPCHGNEDGRGLFRMVKVEKCGPDYIQCQNLPIEGKNPPARPYSTYNVSKIIGEIEIIAYRGGDNEFVNPLDVMTETD